MSCEDIPSLTDLENTKKRIDHFAELIDGTASGTSTNPVTGEVLLTYKQAIDDLGFKPGSGDFTTGFTVLPGQYDIAWRNPVDNNWYSYLGVIPSGGYTVLPGTNPVGSSLWKPVNDLTLRGELASNSGATLSGTSDGSTVQEKLDKSDAIHLLGNKIPETYGNQNSSIAVSRRSSRTDNHVWFLGDSHGWGEGAPEYNAIADITGWSVHSSPLGNRGFVAQTIEKLCRVREWDPATYLSGNVRLGGRAMNGLYAETAPGTDPEKTRSVGLIFGEILSNATNLAATRTRSCDKFYRPLALDDTYSVLAYRDKVAVGRFAKSMMTLRHETAAKFAVDTKKYFAQLPVDPAYAAGASGFVDVLGDGGAVIATRQTSSGITYLITTAGYPLPFWAVVGSNVILPGYGLVKVQTQLVGGPIEIRNADGTTPSATILKYIHQGVRLYPGAYLEKAVVSVDFDSHHSRAYIAVRTGPGYGKMRVYFTDAITTGGRSDPFITSSGQTKSATTYSATKPSPQLIYVYSMKQDGSFEAADPSVTIQSAYVEIECNTVSSEEAIYVFDFGGRTTGRLFIESVETNKEIGIRGVVFDNNLAMNYSMGAHTVGAWLGEESSNAAETRDHIGDLLAYTPVRPSSVVVQVPFVNEYIKQTPIATFSARLQTLVNRINGHLPVGQNQLGTSFIFYTTLRNREIAFAGAGQSTVTYDMYVAATKLFCETNGFEFIDIEKKLLEVPSKIGLPYQRLFLNSNHPSDFANMLIADELCFHIMSVG